MGGIVEPVVEPPVLVTSILGTVNNDTLSGTPGSDTILGLAGNDVLFGGGGRDSIYGGEGDDYLVYVSGDRLFGGAGIDTVSFDLSSRNAGINLNNVSASSPLNSIETLNGTLTAFNDTLIVAALGGPSPSGMSFVYGGAGQDSLVLNYSSLLGSESVVVGAVGSNIVAERYQGAAQLGAANLHNFEIVTIHGSLNADSFNMSEWAGGLSLRLFGGAGNDTLSASSAAHNAIYGGVGDDTLMAQSGNGMADSLHGGSGDDTFWFVTGQDQIFGGAGVDAVNLNLSAAVTGASIGKLLGASYRDIENYYGTLTRYTDTVRLVWAATAFDGNSGQLDGAAGNDTLVLDFGRITDLGYGAVSTASAGAGSGFSVRLFGANGTISDDLTYPGFEHVTLLGSAGNDSLLGVDLAETLRGRDGDDWLRGGRYGDLLDGGAGNDSLQGDASGSPGANDTLYGGSGDDVLESEAGHDLLFGGDGADGLFGNYGVMRAYGGNGDDTLTGWMENDLLNGGNDNDSLDAETGADTLLGGLGDDWLGGGFGDDQMLGAEGNDSLYGDTGFDGGGGADSLYGGDGVDWLSGDGGSDLLYGGDGNDMLYGSIDFAISVDDDSLFGGRGDDKLFGYDGNDMLSGGTGNDILRGGNGDDTLAGSVGVDRFVFDFNHYASDNHDTITDYTAGEVISFAQPTPFGPGNITIIQVGADQLISWGNGTLTLLNYSGTVTFAFNADVPLG